MHEQAVFQLVAAAAAAAWHQRSSCPAGRKSGCPVSAQ